MKKACVLFCILCGLSIVGCDFFNGDDADNDADLDDGADDDPPGAPVLGEASHDAGAVTLTWTSAEADLDGFVIGRSDGTWNDAYATITDGSARTWTDAGALVAGTDYSYKVKAKRGAAYSGFSNTVSITIPYAAIAIAPPYWARTVWQGTGTTWTITSDNVTNTQGLDVKTHNEANKSTPQACYTESLSNSTTYQITYNGSVYYQFSNASGASAPSSISVNMLGTTTDTLSAADRAEYASASIGTLKYVPAGRFQRDASETNVSVITVPFRMSRFEITRAQFSARMGTDPSAASYSGGTSDPVQTVNWYHAIAFCNKLSLAESLTPAYSVSVGGAPVNWSTLSYGSIPTAGNSDWDAATVNWDANGYRLPTETEWMWAAMGAPAAGLGGDTDTAGYAKAFAGSTGSNAIGDYAVFGYDSGETGATTLLRSSSFGSKLANELGLYDMSGNVWELCWDLYGSYPSGTLTDYRGAASGATRVTRGGSWWNGAGACQMTDRGATTPSETFFARGFRVVRR